VYAGRTRLGEEFVKAAVALEKDLDVAGVRRHCEKNLVYYKCPKQIIPVGALPRSPAGKIIRGELP
jgi:acyl-CoA synthetase (AMP-forming)/AMP-acid ligase II